MHGMTHASTASTGGVARELAIREKSYRGPSEIQPIGSRPTDAASPAEFFRRRAGFGRAARRFDSPLGPVPVIPSWGCCAAVYRGKRSQQVAPQVPRVTV